MPFAAPAIILQKKNAAAHFELQQFFRMIQFVLSGYSKFQKCAFQNAVLQVSCQIDKIIAVAAHTNDQVTMAFWMQFRILQILRRSNRHGKLLAATGKIVFLPAQ